METTSDSPALGRTLHDLYTALTLVYHEAEGLPRNDGNGPLFAFLARMDDPTAGRTFLAEHGVAVPSTNPEELLATLVAALHCYRARLQTERKRQQNAEPPMK